MDDILFGIKEWLDEHNYAATLEIYQNAIELEHNVIGYGMNTDMIIVFKKSPHQPILFTVCAIDPADYCFFDKLSKALKIND